MKNKVLRFKATSLDDAGQLEAVFSTFDVIDSDGDVIKSSAIKDGTLIPLVWAHDWTKPVGKGIITNNGKQAIFKGRFNLNTTWGRDAYESVKDMEDLQEYSWGFQVLDSEKSKQDGIVVNNITDTRAFEVSPVLVGANNETGTISVKHSHPVSTVMCTKHGVMGKECVLGDDHEEKMYVDASVDGSFEELRDRLNCAFRDRQFGAESTSYGYSYVVATFDDRFIALMWQWDDEEDTYWEVSYSINGEEILLGDPKQVTPETSFVPVNGQGMSYEQHSDFVQAGVSELLRRSKYLVDTVKRKEGKPISSARRERMQNVQSWLQDAAKEVQALLDETVPATQDNDSEIDGKSLYAQFLRIEAEQLGVK